MTHKKHAITNESTVQNNSKWPQIRDHLKQIYL